MTDIEQKALALINDVRMERGWDAHTIFSRHNDTTCEALCRAIEQREAFRQEVSDVVTSLCNTLLMGSDHSQICEMLSRRFIIPAPKPDPLVEIAEAWGLHNIVAKSWVEDLRAALDALGFEIKEKGR